MSCFKIWITAWIGAVIAVQIHAADFVILSSQGDTAVYTAPISSNPPTAFTWTDITSGFTTGIMDAACSVHYDPVDKKIYWVERKDDTGKVRRANIDGSNEEDVATNVDIGRGLTLDIYNRIVYYTIQQGSRLLHEVPMSLAGGPVGIPNTDQTMGPAGCIDYGPCSNSLYVGYREGYVQRYSIDGRTSEYLCGDQDGLDKIPGIAVDEIAGELFVQETDNSANDYLWRIDLQSGVWCDKTLMFTETANSGGSRGIDIYKEYVYVTDLKTDVIYAIPRNAQGLTSGQATAITNTFGSGGTTFFDIAFYQEPIACVQNLVVAVDSPTQLTLSWDISLPCCLADWYTITAVPSNIDQCDAATPDGSDINIDWQEGSSVTFEDLVPFTEYTFTVTAALNDDDNPSVRNVGMTREMKGTTAESAPLVGPGLVVVAASDTFVELAFYEPPCGSKGGTIVSYTYYCSTTDRSAATQGGTTLTTTPAVKIPDMSCDDGMYTCYAAAITNGGTGPFAEVLVDGTVASVPTSPPCNLIIDEATSTEITFSWEKCDCGTRGGATQTYTYELLSNGYTVESGVTDELEVSFNVQACEEEYEFRVAVTTSAGVGPFFDIISRDNGRRAMPPKPVIVESFVFDDEIEVEIQEQPCVLNVQIVIAYVYTLYRMSTKRQVEIVNSGEIPVEPDLSSIIDLSNLVCGTTYELSVAAMTESGIGPETIYTFRTEDSSYPFVPGSSLSVVNLGPSTAVISWEDTVPSCPPLSAYKVDYTLINLEQCQVQMSRSRVSVGRTTDAEVTLHNLKAGSTYEVSITAQTSEGTDVVLQDTWITPETAPTVPPTNVRIRRFDANELIVDWDEPPCGTRGGAISYTYELLTPSPDSDPEPLVQNVLNSGAIIDPPAGYVHYIFKVAVVNSAGMKYSDYINISPDAPISTEGPGFCSDDFCQNGGTCSPETNSCSCLPGYSGIQCEVQAERSGGPNTVVLVTIVTTLSIIAIATVAILACWFIRVRRNAAKSPPMTAQPYQTYNNGDVRKSNIVVWDSRYPGTTRLTNALQAFDAPQSISSPWDQPLQLMPNESHASFPHRYF